MNRKIGFTLLIILQTIGGYAQQFDPFDGNSGLYHADMRKFFSNPSTEQLSRQKLLDSLKAFEQQHNWTAQNMRGRLDSYQNMVSSLQRHYQYFRLMAERDRKDTVARKAREELARQLDVSSARMDSVLQLPVYAHLTQAAIQSNGLQSYRYLLIKAKEQARYNLSPQAEQVSNATAGQMLNRLTDRYDDLIDSIKPGKTKALSLQAYGKHGELFAATLIDITRLKDAVAITHHYHSAPEQNYADRLQLSEDSVKAIFAKVAASIQVLKNYQQLPAPAVLPWQPMHFAQVRELINNALAPLGESYQAHFARLLDPANGLLDIAPAPGRAGGGNSFGTIGTPIGLYMQGFDGGFRNTSTLIHEGGHAIHRQLMSESKVLPVYASGPNFLSEAYAMLNELLLLDELKSKANTIAERAYFTRLFADKLAREIFTSAEEGSFEQGLYEGVTAGKVNGFKDINGLYAGIMRSYDLNFAAEPERETEWITKRLVFEDPLYNANYLFAILVTCKLYQLHLQDPKGFAAKFQALLSSGFSEPAAASIKRHMGFQLDYSTLLANALRLMEIKTTELKHLMEAEH